MKKMAALFTESMREFRNIRTITACGLFAALALILNSFTVQIGNYLKIGVSGLPNEMVDVLFGPAVGSLFAAAMDILKLLLYPTGAWIPGLTLNCLLAGLIYGFFLYRKPTNFWRILAAELTVALLVNVLLGTFWLSQVYGKAFMVMLPARLIKNVIKAPVDSIILYLVMTVLERAGVFRMLKIFRPGKSGVKLEVFASLEGKVDLHMLNAIAASLDLELSEGSLEEQYDTLKSCLMTLERYECNRLR